MTNIIPSKAPNLPLATVQYEPRYQDQFANILRLYFNTIDNALAEIIRILNHTGPFDTVYAKTIEATDVNTVNVNTTNLTALVALIQKIQANIVSADNFQGGNGVFNQLTGANVNASLFTGDGRQINFPHGSFYQNGVTTLTGNITNVSVTPIPVVSTAEFAAPGYLLIGSEVISYTTKDATNFDGTITRGVCGTTNVAHNNGDYVTDAAAVTAGSSAAINFDTVVASYGVTITVPDSKFYFTYAGVYNIQFSAQFLNFTNTEDNITVWLKKNNVDVPVSASIAQVNSKHGSYPGAAILSLNYVDAFAAGDYFQLYWTSDSGNTVLVTYPPGTGPTHPASPAIILTVSYVSAPPSPKIQITPIGVAGYCQIGKVNVVVT